MHSRFITPLLLAGFVLCWSSGFIGSRVASEAPMDALDLFAWRFSIATVIAFIIWKRVQTRRVSVKAWLNEMLVGSLTMGGYLLSIMLAVEHGVSASVSALITSQQPLLAAAFAFFMLKEALPLKRIIGLIAAAAGVLLCVAGDWQNASGSAPIWAYALPVAAVFSVTVGSILSARKPSGMGISASLTAQLSAASLLFWLVAVLNGGIAAPQINSANLEALVWLVVLSTFGGYGFFIASLRRAGVTAVSTAIYFAPPVTLIWSIWQFHESVSALQIGGMLLALAGALYALIQRDGQLSQPRSASNSTSRAEFHQREVAH